MHSVGTYACVLSHTQVHIYTHISTHTGRQAYTQIYIYTRIYTHTSINTVTQTDLDKAHTQAYTLYTNIFTHAHTNSRQAHTRTRTVTHARTHAHAFAYTRNFRLSKQSQNYLEFADVQKLLNCNISISSKTRDEARGRCCSRWRIDGKRVTEEMESGRKEGWKSICRVQTKSVFIRFAN